ncbi:MULTISPECIES: pyrimidine/purine nucleoside phosphorylase [unclassified Vibrio]|uniref:Pyrimidine/purine nucleoside phosphorylase n=1 Tax=Vibrio sp. HB236076 TaxID=3232307 RepID=A0AB39HEN5_9VIBR|nr:pyrimidine/purine nucleoside phosphorylase [Vibrio sp. HB161653]MDP5252794.1 pyrimidine/purine nucleoside phosphorylase [Vibrio sp. HB161653]
MIKENSYFEGQVKSLGFVSSGDTSSVGVMAKGEYTFTTQAPEKMTVIKGQLTVKLPGSVSWQTFSAGQSFEVPGDDKFLVQVEVDSAYLCDYL